MGLRLYQPPVDSDIQSKPAADRGPAQSRSTIRRTRLPRNSNQILERRRRVLAATAAYSGFESRRDSSGLESPVVSGATTTDTNAANPGRALRDVASRMGILDDRVVAMFGERWAHLHAESNPSPLRDDDNGRSPMLTTMAVDSEFLPRSRPPPEPYTLSSIRSTQSRLSRSARRSPPPPQWSAEPEATDRLRRTEGAFRDDARSFSDIVVDGPQPRARLSSLRRSEQTPAFEATRLDGLGDRNRSLSPEGDNVWDTLLSTLTPDPQPPSVGSSFASASASASAAASQRTAANSARTSFTTPDTAEESAFEPPCESGCDNSDTEGDDEDEMAHIQLPSFAGLRRYSDRARNNTSEDPLELLGGIGGMQRIVRNLARREDIPDEWWAEAGLSRTLSREASAN